MENRGGLRSKTIMEFNVIEPRPRPAQFCC